MSECVIEKRIRRVVAIDDMHSAFTAGRSTADAVFIVRQVQKQFLAKHKELWMAFVDLDKEKSTMKGTVVGLKKVLMNG